MIRVDLSTRECDGHVIVALRGKLDMADAVSVAVLAAVAARAPETIVDLAGLEFIDCGGVAALARGRTQARHAGGDLRLAAAQQQVLRVLTLTGLIEGFPVHARVDEAGRQRRPLLAGSRASGRQSRPRRRDMISAGSSMPRPRDNSYRSDGAQHATGEVVQDQRAPGAPLCACNQEPGTVTRNRPATLALRATQRPLAGRFAGPGISGPAQTGVATGRRGKCRSPPVTGGPGDPAWPAAAQPNAV